MTNVVHKVSLSSVEHFGSRVPPAPMGKILESFSLLTNRSLRMRLLNSASSRKRSPDWVKRAGDIRLVEMDGSDDTNLYFAVPRLGDVAEEFYAQTEMWDEKPDPEDTAFDIMGSMLTDVWNHNTDSLLFDTKVLEGIVSFRKGFEKGFTKVTIFDDVEISHELGFMTPELIKDAKELQCMTPLPRRVRVEGTLDMIRASTRTFMLKLDSGESVRGSYLVNETEEIGALFEKRVSVYGEVSYRPSGKALAIKADEINLATEVNSFFSVLPTGISQSHGQKILLSDGMLNKKRGVAALFGKWPGDESDEEFAAMVRELNS